MNIKTSRYAFCACFLINGIMFFAVCGLADAASLTPIPSAQAVSGSEADCNQCASGEDGCVECDSGYSSILTDNIVTRTIYSLSRDFKRNNCWPRPFVWKDREATRASFVIMVNKGWQSENTLGEFHFNPETNKINEAGRLRVHWIVTQGLPSRRAIFVQRAMHPEETESRVDSVQQWVAQIVPRGSLPPVLETNRPAPSRPAEEVDYIRQEYLKSMPTPRLPAVDSIDTGSSSL